MVKGLQGTRRLHEEKLFIISREIRVQLTMEEIDASRGVGM